MEGHHVRANRPKSPRSTPQSMSASFLSRKNSRRDPFRMRAHTSLSRRAWPPLGPHPHVRCSGLVLVGCWCVVQWLCVSFRHPCPLAWAAHPPRPLPSPTPPLLAHYTPLSRFPSQAPCTPWTPSPNLPLAAQRLRPAAASSRCSRGPRRRLLPCIRVHKMMPASVSVRPRAHPRRPQARKYSNCRRMPPPPRATPPPPFPQKNLPLSPSL